MRVTVLSTLAAAAAAAVWPATPGPYEPWGIHLAYGQDGRTQMTAMWSTSNPVAGAVVRYGIGAANLTVVGEVWEFAPTDCVPQQLHRVYLAGLQPGATYTYLVGDGAGNWSEASTFSTQPADPSAWSLTFGIYGDMGISQNAEDTMPWLIKDVQGGAIDVMVHIGDLAYNLDDDQGTRGDSFMQQITPVSSKVPYHACPGNHEDANDFVQYRMRMGSAMPLANSPSQGGNGTFHSVDIGPVHWALVSSEVYFSLQPHSAGLLVEQQAWLKQDLAAVNRTKTPWVALGLHQPFYCSANDDTDDCHQVASLVRLGLEQIIIDGGVDVVFGAHEHAYERNAPVGPQFAWDDNLNASAYINPRRPVHILTGAAGCPENFDPWQPAAKANPFSVLRINDYGYSRMTVINATHLVLQYVDNQKGAILDQVTLVQTNHGPFTAAA